jgi:acetyl-CoA synthetase (ADP-forming)
VVKTGRTEAGVVSARSHTASLAGSFEVFEAMCREEGAVIAHDPDDMVRAAHFLVRHRRPRRGGIAILSTSGGGAGIACDRVSELGLLQAVLSDETRAALGELLLPPQANNPVDLGGRAPENVEISGEVARLLFDDPNVAYGLVILTSMPFFAKRSRLIAESAQAIDKPVMIVFTPGAAADGPREALREIGQFYFDRPEDALRVLALLAEHDALKAVPRPPVTRPAGLPSSAMPGSGPLSAAEATRWLRAYGVPVARDAVVSTPEAAAEAAARLGFPVVLKAVSRDVVHKSELGAVRLGLSSPAEVAAAAREMAARLAQFTPPVRLEGYLVQETVSGETEVIVGARHDPQFGPVVLVGLGGIAVEILKDVALAPVPVTPARARRMLDSLAAAPLFHGARGRSSLDVETVADVVSRISWLAADLGPRLVDFEVNPLIVRAEGEGAIAVDSRGTLTDPFTKEPHP